LHLSKCRTVDELVRAMGDTAFTGRQSATLPMFLKLWRAIRLLCGDDAIPVR